MKTTPYIHRDQSVSLKLDLKVQALAGSSINQIPILTNRQFTAALDLKDGESALVTSDLSSQEARAVSGLPGLSEIPGLQSTTNKECSAKQRRAGRSHHAPRCTPATCLRRQPGHAPAHAPVRAACCKPVFVEKTRS